LQFRHLHLENFLSYKTFDFDFSDSGLYLVTGVNHDEGGSNASGKTAIWDAISWALFGTTIRGLKGDGVVNRVYRNNCLVHVVFNLRGHTYSVKRYRKSKEYGSRFIVEKDGESHECSSVADTQKWFLDDIGIDFDLYRCTVVFAQEEKFNFINETDKKQKEILAKVKRLSFDGYIDAIKEKIRGIEDKESDYDRKLLVLKSHQKEDVRAEFEDKVRKFEQDEDERVGAATRELERVEVAICKAEKDNPDIKAKLGGLHTKLSAIEDNMNELRTKYITVKSGIKDCDRIIEKNESLKGVCETCGSEIDEELRDKQIAKASERLEKLEFIEKRILKKIEKLKAESTDIRCEIDNLKEKLVSDFDLKSFGRMVERLKNECKRRGNPYEADIEKEEARQKKIAEKISAIKKDLKTVTEEKPYYLFWKEAYSDRGIKSFIFDTLCDDLTVSVNDYVSILMNRDVAIAFDTQKTLKSGETREKFEAIILDKGRTESYASYSGGNKTAISLSVDLSLSDLMAANYGSTFNMVVFDEQDTWLDASARERYLNLLKRIAKTRQVFVVSHDEELKSRFDNVIAIEKRDDVSRLVS
jgi:DNA repair exonuclease SbcCD ATPase subunit